MNIPNGLTCVRLFLIPVIVVVHYLPYDCRYWVASAIFLLASCTDWFDGYLARRLNQATPFGAFLDPVADKVMVAVALVVLIEKFNNPLMTVPGLIIIGREIVISGLREWMAELGKRTSVAVSYVGKVKTVAQMSAVNLLLLARELGAGVVGSLGLGLLLLAATLTLWSMCVYLVASWPDLMDFRHQKK
ncbi:MAG: CDP-diacylglycerol--glycerol-3-phosphate 3-phosphatidyltransferase [Kistimonas sp.]|nr:CDP-diacylglycerol--glycerol-3-phosphate 3-phosphatidyltransferase [Kistimonas sp.]